MKRRQAIHLIGISGVAFTLCYVLLAGDDFTFHNDVRLVLLDVSVHDRAGKFVAGLSRRNFTVFEDGRLQVVSVFDDQDAPVSMGLLVDESASMNRKRVQVLAAAEALIGESNPADQVFVLNFNDNVTRGLPENVLFSNSIQELHTALYRGYPQGKTALYDAVADGLQQLQAGQRGRKTLVLITDGGDTASHHKRAQTIHLLEQSTATIFAVGLFEEDEYEIDPGLLRELARISGGEAFFPRTDDAVADACRQIAKEIRSRYTIGYIPSGDRGLPDLRRIHVSVSAPGRSGLTVRTRTSYRYDQTSQ